MKRDRVIVGIKRAIEARFTDSDWQELGYLTGTHEWIDGHPRLLRSLSWGDPDYPGHVLDAVERILEEDPANLDVLIENLTIRAWLSDNDAATLSEVGDATSPVAQPALAVSSDAVRGALDDAEVLIGTSGPPSAVDRVHTALHAYLIALCDAEGIAYNPQPGLTHLFKVLRQHHPGLQAAGAGQPQVDRILNSFANVLQALNEFRNHASPAHPAQALLGRDEAMLAINSTRTLFAYLNAKC